MNWPFQGTLLSLLVMGVILIDIFRNSNAEPLKHERFFIRIVIIYQCLLGIEFLFILIDQRPHSLLNQIMQTCMPLRTIGTPLMFYLWFHYIVYNLNLKKIVKELLSSIFLLPLLMFILISFIDVFSNRLFDFSIPRSIDSLGEILQIAICLLYTSTTLGFALFIPAEKSYGNKYLFAWITLPLLAGSILRIFNGSSLAMTAAFSVTVLTNYFLFQSWKILYDTLLGLPNRKAFVNDLAKLFEREGKSGTILITDIENFKSLNQKFSQPTGDQLLQLIAGFYTSVVPKYTVYHLYADQFAVIFQDLTLNQTLPIAEILVNRFSSSWVLPQTSVLINTHIALVCFPSQVHTPEEAINSLDFTLSIAKEDAQSSQSHIVVYDQAILEKRQRQSEIAEALHKAVNNRQMIVHYQPILNCHSGKFSSAEALVRFTDSKLGDLMPGEFIPIAEQTGLIAEMTYQVLEQVCIFLKQLEKTSNPLERISINLSAVHFLHSDMSKRIVDTVRLYGIEPSLIEFELTESSVIDSVELVRKTMEYLAMQGFSFSLDDYGTGYSNVEYLMDLPFSTVKLDRRIIANYRTHAALLESLLLMIHKIGKESLAEGVETEDQYQVLQVLGADRIQGFWLSHPLPSQAFLAKIAEKMPRTEK